MMHKPQSRRAWTLVEMVATIAVGSAMMGIAVAVLYLLLALDRDSREALDRRTATASLARQFRDDVHGATRFDLVELPAGEEKALPAWQLTVRQGHVIRYEHRGDELDRIERVDGNPVGQESFALSPDVAVAMELADDGRAPIVSLTIVPVGQAVEEPLLRPLRIDAVLGADRRFSGPQEP